VLDTRDRDEIDNLVESQDCEWDDEKSRRNCSSISAASLFAAPC
jgi:hypothetical protein